MHSCCEILQWDTDFFGFKVARIITRNLETNRLETILNYLRAQGVRLVYWPSDPKDQESQAAAQFLCGILVDKKVTYLIDFEQSTCDVQSKLLQGIEEYTEISVTTDLESLAIQAGVFSRFSIDPNIPREQFEQLYRLWMQNSANKTIADAVFVALHEERIVGMVTVGIKKGRGDIGLIAVSEEVRGRGIAAKLVSVAQEWSRKRGCRYAQVVTQGENQAACRLYEKTGYRIEFIENIYHFWL